MIWGGKSFEQSRDTKLALLENSLQNIGTQQEKLFRRIDEMSINFTNFSMETKDALQAIANDVKAELTQIKATNEHISDQLKDMEIVKSRLTAIETNSSRYQSVFEDYKELENQVEKIEKQISKHEIILESVSQNKSWVSQLILTVLAGLIGAVITTVAVNGLNTTNTHIPTKTP